MFLTSDSFHSLSLCLASHQVIVQFFSVLTGICRDEKGSFFFFFLRLSSSLLPPSPASLIHPIFPDLKCLHNQFVPHDNKSSLTTFFPAHIALFIFLSSFIALVVIEVSLTFVSSCLYVLSFSTCSLFSEKVTASSHPYGLFSYVDFCSLLQTF